MHAPVVYFSLALAVHSRCKFNHLELLSGIFSMIVSIYRHSVDHYDYFHLFLSLFLNVQKFWSGSNPLKSELEILFAKEYYYQIYSCSHFRLCISIKQGHSTQLTGCPIEFTFFRTPLWFMIPHQTLFTLVSAI